MICCTFGLTMIDLLGNMMIHDFFFVKGSGILEGKFMDRAQIAAFSYLCNFPLFVNDHCWLIVYFWKRV